MTNIPSCCNAGTTSVHWKMEIPEVRNGVPGSVPHLPQKGCLLVAQLEYKGFQGLKGELH